MSITIKREEEVVSLLENPAFIKKWDGLLNRCRWATPYQSYGYVSSWYEAYIQEYYPLLIFKFSPHDRLDGLLPLAIHKKHGSIQVAGTHQAEYQSWLADNSCEETFIQDVIEAIFQHFNPAEIKFKYVLEAVPLNWIHKSKWKKYCVVHSTKRPLINFEKDTFNLKSIANKTFKRYLNHLKRQGEVKYSQIKDRDAFLKILPKFEAMYDFRMLTTYGMAPFSSDKCKRAFHLAMFDREGLLHVAVLRVENKIVAFEIAVKDEKTVYCGVTSFSPLFARLSPSRIYLFYLFQDLSNKKYSFYDFTPGRDPWKHRIANEYETVSEIRIFNSQLRQILARLKFFLKEQIVQILIKLGMKPGNLWIMARSLGHNLVRGIFFDLVKTVFPQVNVLYRVDIKLAGRLPEANPLSRDNVEDFLVPGPKIADGLFNNFLADSQRCFHRGQHSYTATVPYSFLFCGWLAEAYSSKQIPTTLPDELRGRKVAIIHNITSAGNGLTTGFMVDALTQMIRDAAAIPEIETVVVVLPKNEIIMHTSVDVLNKKYSMLFKKVVG